MFLAYKKRPLNFVFYYSALIFFIPYMNHFFFLCSVYKKNGGIFFTLKGAFMKNNSVASAETDYFSLKTELVLFVATILLFFIETSLIAFSERIIPVLYNIFSEKIFHRGFSLEKWLPTLQSFILIPVFIAVFSNVVIFYKHTNKFKVIYLATLVFCIAFLVTYTVFVSMHRLIDSDLSGETLLALECVREKSFVPVGWRYSTELRLLNTQLISAPLFLITSNWDAVRALTSLFSCAVLFWAGWLLISRLGVKKAWLKLFGAAMLSCPWSTLHFYVIGWGNYYIPHIVLGFVTLAVFIPILNGNSKNEKVSVALFYLLAFISGLSTIRYILAYQFPLTLSVVILLYKQNDSRKNITFYELKNFFCNSKPLSVALIALFLSGFGYLVNSLVLQPLYNFSQWNKEQFNLFGDVTLHDLFCSILRAFGYQEGVSVFTPSGVVNICVYIALAFFVANMIKALKLKCSIERKFVLIFTVCTISFNSFLYYHIDFISRYYITILAYMIPCIVIFIDDVELGVIKRYFVGTAFAFCIFISSFTSPQSYLVRDDNKDVYPVMNFLRDKVAMDPEYSFGYSTRDFANMITYFTNGKIEVAGIKKQDRYLSEVESSGCLPRKFEEVMGLTPSRYYTYKHDGKTFLMLSNELYKNSAGNTVFEAGKEVYNDGKFIVFEYESQKAFLDSFEK